MKNVVWHHAIVTRQRRNTQDKGIYQADSNYEPTKKQKKHRLMLKLEKLFGLELSKKHYKLVK